MSTQMANPDLRRKIKVRMRPDLVINKQRYAGQTYFIVKDPVAMKYYRFREEELFLLQQFDGERTFDDVRHEFVERFRPQRISVSELEKFVNQLLQAGIATADTEQIGQRLFERYKKKRFQKIKQFFMNVVYIKIPIFDPERLLEKMLPYTAFFFGIPFFILMIMLGLSSAALITINWETFVSKLPSYNEFFTWRNLMYFWVTLGIVKIIHEFGHGISCKKFGGEVHEMGFLLLVLTPCLYCNVTDAWMLPNKWHRVVIGAAGIYIELVLSAIFVWVWWFTEPGLLNTLSLSIIFICSVSTVLFNGNPLLRFDGYYILSDLIEIPNLRERSNKYLGNTASKVFFGAEAVADPYVPKKNKWFFIFYAIAAYLYRWLVVVGILYFLYTFLKPYKLGAISFMLGTLAAFSMLVMPAYKVFKTLKSRWRSMKVNKVRMFSTVGTAACLIATILLWPIPMRIDIPMLLQPKDANSVFVQTSGVLAELYVEDGEYVTSGMPLARLKDPQIDMDIARLELELRQFNRAQQTALALNELDQVRINRVQADTVKKQLERLESQRRRLLIVVPEGVEGTVMTPPKERDISTTLQQGQVFCQIGDPDDLEAYMVVEHSDTSLIANPNNDDQTVWIKLTGHVGDIIETKVEKISNNELEVVPPQLSNKYGGEVATTTDPDNNYEKPLFKSYAVQAPIPGSGAELALTPGVRGIARVDIGERSIYWRAKRYLQQTFHFRM